MTGTFGVLTVVVSEGPLGLTHCPFLVALVLSLSQDCLDLCQRAGGVAGDGGSHPLPAYTASPPQAQWLWVRWTPGTVGVVCGGPLWPVRSALFLCPLPRQKAKMGARWEREVGRASPQTGSCNCLWTPTCRQQALLGWAGCPRENSPSPRCCADSRAGSSLSPNSRLIAPGVCGGGRFWPPALPSDRLWVRTCPGQHQSWVTPGSGVRGVGL